jgi:hypothetical protein
MMLDFVMLLLKEVMFVEIVIQQKIQFVKVTRMRDIQQNLQTIQMDLFVEA